MVDLFQLGWCDELQRSSEGLGDTGLIPARVARAYPGQVHVYSQPGERVVTIPNSHRVAPDQTPVAGDWVLIDPARDLLHRIIPRRSVFARQASGERTEQQVVAANIDILFATMGLDVDFSVRRLERYLALAHHGKIAPVVLLTKAGLCPTVPEMVRAAKESAAGVPVHALDVIDGINAGVPGSYVPHGVTAAFVGSSGVGKSTVINHLMAGVETLRTSSVRRRDGRGKHTTTWRELLPIPSGGAVIDTPGMRELRLALG